MKNNFYFLSFLLVTSLALISACGEAGIQVRVGDDYGSDFEVENQLFSGFFDEGSTTTTINEEILEYGDFIKDLEVRSLTMEFEGVSQEFIADIEFDINGQIVSLSDIRVSNSTSQLIGNINLLSLADALKNGELNLSYTMDSTDPGPLDVFTLILSFEVFATVQAD